MFDSISSISFFFFFLFIKVVISIDLNCDNVVTELEAAGWKKKSGWFEEPAAARCSPPLLHGPVLAEPSVRAARRGYARCYCMVCTSAAVRGLPQTPYAAFFTKQNQIFQKDLRCNLWMPPFPSLVCCPAAEDWLVLTRRCKSCVIGELGRKPLWACGRGRPQTPYASFFTKQNHIFHKDL